jgi:hypothetical protein
MLHRSVRVAEIDGGPAKTIQRGKDFVAPRDKPVRGAASSARSSGRERRPMRKPGFCGGILRHGGIFGAFAACAMAASVSLSACSGSSGDGSGGLWLAVQ